MAGLSLAAIAALGPPGVVFFPGLTCWIGASGGVVAWATGRLLTARAMLHPIPAPPTAATTAMRTMYAAIRLQTDVGGGGGMAIQAGGGGVASDVDDGSSVWSDRVR